MDRQQDADQDAAIVAALVHEADADRRFAGLADFVTANPARAAEIGVHLLSRGPKERELGADLLGQVATVDASTRSRSAERLTEILASEQDGPVLAAVVTALGHIRDHRAVGGVLALGAHPDSDVRSAVAFALPLLGLTDESLDLLRLLSQDADDDVRDWATFALAESDANDDRTVASLLDRAADRDDDVRAEAIYGLARRGHPRAHVLVAAELQGTSPHALIERARDELGSIRPIEPQ